MYNIIEKQKVVIKYVSSLAFIIKKGKPGYISITKTSEL